MVFPDLVTTRFELWTGSQWENITGDVYHRDGLVIERGRKNEASSTDPGRAAFTLNNRSGKYSPRNPMSPLYGVIGRNTPVRISVQGPETYLRIADMAGSRVRAGSSSGLNITADLDIRVELALDRLPTQFPLDIGNPYDKAQQEIVARDQDGDRGWRLFLGPSGQLEFTWSPDGTNAIGHYSTDFVPYRSGERFAVRATMDTNNGSGGYTLVFYWADSLAGPWNQLGDVITGGSTTSIHNAASPLDIGDAQFQGYARGAGRYYALELRNGINGPVIANPDFTAQSPGTTSFSDAAGNTWTLNAPAEITDYYTRFTGGISVWPQRWDVSGKDVWTPVEASGILRRLGQGNKPLDSTLRRRVPSVEPFPLAYWPMEEGKSAERISSAVAGVPDLDFTGFTFDSNSDLSGSKPLPEIGASASFGALITGAAPGAWQAEYVYFLEAPPASGTPVMMRVHTTGNVWNRFDVEATSNAVRVMAYNTVTETSSLIINALNTAFTGKFTRLRLFSWQSGGSTMVRVHWMPIGEPTGYFLTHTYTGTAGAITRVSSPFGPTLEGMTVGHLAVWDSNDVHSMDGADSGFRGEFSLDRIRRLAYEEKLTVSAPGFFTLTEQVGPQTITTALDLMQETADADGATLFELRGVTGLQYEPRYRSYNPRYALELDYAADGEVAPPLEPVDDDQGLRNDVTVTRDGGASSRAVLESGPLSTNPPPAGVGVYNESVTLNLSADAQTADSAGWRLHTGAWDEARYPVVVLDLRAAPHLAQTVLDRLDVTSFVRIVNPPPWLPPDPIRLRVEGYDESIAQDEWRIRLQCSPAGPWNVAVTDDDTLGRADTDGSQLSTGITTSATSISVATTDGPIWTTDAGEFPFPVRVGGEVMTVTAISGASSPQTFTVVRGVNGITKTHSTGTKVALDQPAVVSY